MSPSTHTHGSLSSQSHQKSQNEQKWYAGEDPPPLSTYTCPMLHICQCAQLPQLCHKLHGRTLRLKEGSLRNTRTCRSATCSGVGMPRPKRSRKASSSG